MRTQKMARSRDLHVSGLLVPGENKEDDLADDANEAAQWPEWTVDFADVRGKTTVRASDIVLDDGIWVFWRGRDAFLRVPEAHVRSVLPPVVTP